MKIKPIIALTAFAASMGAFAQMSPAPQAGPGAQPEGQRLQHTFEQRETLRKDVREFHHAKEGRREARQKEHADLRGGNAVDAKVKHERAEAATKVIQEEKAQIRADREALAQVKREHREEREARREKREGQRERREARREARDGRWEHRRDEVNSLAAPAAAPGGAPTAH